MYFSSFLCDKLPPNAGLEINTTFIYNFTIMKLMGSRLSISAKRASYWCGYSCRFPSRTCSCGGAKQGLPYSQNPSWTSLYCTWWSTHIMFISVMVSMSSTLTVTCKCTWWRKTEGQSDTCTHEETNDSKMYLYKHIFDNIRMNEINIDEWIRSTDERIRRA